MNYNSVILQHQNNPKMNIVDFILLTTYPVKGNNAVGWSLGSQGPTVFIFE